MLNFGSALLLAVFANVVLGNVNVVQCEFSTTSESQYVFKIAGKDVRLVEKNDQGHGAPVTLEKRTSLREGFASYVVIGPIPQYFHISDSLFVDEKIEFNDGDILFGEDKMQCTLVEDLALDLVSLFYLFGDHIEEIEYADGMVTRAVKAVPTPFAMACAACVATMTTDAMVAEIVALATSGAFQIGFVVASAAACWMFSSVKDYDETSFALKPEKRSHHTYLSFDGYLCMQRHAYNIDVDKFKRFVIWLRDQCNGLKRENAAHDIVAKFSTWWLVS